MLGANGDLLNVDTICILWTSENKIYTNLLLKLVKRSHLHPLFLIFFLQEESGAKIERRFSVKIKNCKFLPAHKLPPYCNCHSPTQPQHELELDLIMGRKPPPSTHTGTFNALPGNLGSWFSVYNLILITARWNMKKNLGFHNFLLFLN